MDFAHSKVHTGPSYTVETDWKWETLECDESWNYMLQIFSLQSFSWETKKTVSREYSRAHTTLVCTWFSPKLNFVYNNSCSCPIKSHAENRKRRQFIYVIIKFCCFVFFLLFSFNRVWEREKSVYSNTQLQLFFSQLAWLTVRNICRAVQKNCFAHVVHYSCFFPLRTFPLAHSHIENIEYSFISICVHGNIKKGIRFNATCQCHRKRLILLNNNKLPVIFLLSLRIFLRETTKTLAPLFGYWE